MTFPILILTLAQSALALNIRNNECSKVLAYHIAPFSPVCRYNPDVLSNVTQIVERHGYRVDTHYVQTGDGYILNVYRISSKESTPTRYPVLVLHGLGVTTSTWVNIGNRSLAFNLVEAGYDVWLGTFRGTSDASHISRTKFDPDYWNYWIDILCKEDYSRQVSYVANETRQKVLVLGHSFATTISFMHASEFSEQANQLIKGIIAVSPVAYLGDILVLHPLSWFGLPLISLLDSLHIRGALYREKTLQWMSTTACKFFPEFCFFILSTVTGATRQFAPEDMLVFVSYFPSGIALKSWKQYFQFARSGRFQKFDFGRIGNLRYYGTVRPPVYNTSRIQVPMVLMYGNSDPTYSKKGIDRLYSELGSSRKYMTAIPINANKKYDFAHVDFINSKNIVKFFYEPLLDIMQTFFN